MLQNRRAAQGNCKKRCVKKDLECALRREDVYDRKKMARAN